MNDAACTLRRGAALHRLARAAAAPRELPGAAGRAARGAAPAAAPARPGALADALPDAPPRRDRRTGRRAAAARPLRRRGVHRANWTRGTQAWERSGQADEESLLDTLRRAHHAEVFRTLVRDVEGAHHGRAGRRRPVGAGRRDARSARSRWAWKHLKQAHRPRAAVRRHRLRQARRQGARLRQRPRRGVRLRRRRRADPESGRGLRRLRAQADRLADAAHRAPASCSTSTPRCARTATPACSSRR